ncbi:hypothetical protein PS2_030868 [Malus domestica]
MNRLKPERICRPKRHRYIVEKSTFIAAELVQIREPPTADLVRRLVAAFHFHQARDLVFLPQKLLHGFLSRGSPAILGLSPRSELRL